MNICKFYYLSLKSDACHFIIWLNNSPCVWKTNRPGNVLKTTSSLYVLKGMKTSHLYSTNPKILVFSVQETICSELPHLCFFLPRNTYWWLQPGKNTLKKKTLHKKPEILASDTWKLSTLGNFNLVCVVHNICLDVYVRGWL